MFPQFNWKDLAIHYERFRAGQRLLLFQVMSMSGPYWHKVIKALNGNFEPIVPDLHFHGQTGDLPNPGMLHAFIMTLVGGPVHIVGHSCGAPQGLPSRCGMPILCCALF